MDFSREKMSRHPSQGQVCCNGGLCGSKLHPSAAYSIPNISIHKFIDFLLPKPTAVVQTIVISQYFSHYDPEPITEQLLERMCWLSMPTSAVVKNLVRIGHQAWLNGSKSIKYIHISDGATTHFPLWLVSFWNEVHNLRTVHNPWIRAKAWLIAELNQKKALQRHTYSS
jgi:hypothetical protein